MKEKIIGTLLGFFYKIYALTFRYRIHFLDPDDSLEKIKKEQSLIAFFHQDELSFPGAIRFLKIKKLCALVSKSKDGQLMASALKVMGIISVRGSSSRSPIEGLFASLKKVQNNYNVIFAVDGPRGPIYNVKNGIIKLSELTNLKIRAVRIIPKSYYCFSKAWDKSKLPYPFTRIDLYIKSPQFYTREELEITLKQMST